MSASLRNYFRSQIATYANVGGIECDVLVDADYQPPEPKVNIGESVEVCRVIVGGLDVMDSMLIDELEELEERLLIEAQDYGSYPHINQARKSA